MGWKPAKGVDPGEASEGAWLNWEDGEVKELTVLNDQPVRHALHWVQGKGQPCEGSGCGLCGLGVRQAQRYTVMVEHDGEQARWEMALLTWRDLAAKAEMRGTLRGLRIAVKRTGTGRQTRYHLDVLEIVPADELPDEPTIEPPAFEDDDEPEAPGASDQRTTLASVQADPAGAAAYAKELAASLGTTAAAALEDLKARNGKDFQHQSSAGQLHALIVHLEHELARLDSGSAAEPEPDLEDLLS